jgi:hypothetical protein
MAAFKRTLTIDRGASYDKQFTWKAGPKGSEVPVVLTGCTARMVVKDAAGATLLTLTTENGGITLGGVNGTVSYYITDEATAVLPPGRAAYQTEVIFADGRVRRFMEGQFVVNAGIE